MLVGSLTAPSAWGAESATTSYTSIVLQSLIKWTMTHTITRFFLYTRIPIQQTRKATVTSAWSSSLDANKWFYLCTNCDYGGHVECFSPDKLEVLSPDLEEPDSPPPEQQIEPQPDGAPQVGNETYDLLQLQLQLKRIQMQNMINMGHSLSWLWETLDMIHAIFN